MSRTLRDLAIGESGVVTAVKGSGVLRQHLLDMGLIPGTSVTVVKFAPMGDPIEIQIYGYELTLRLAEAEHIMVAPYDEAKSEENLQSKSMKTFIQNHPDLRGIRLSMKPRISQDWLECIPLYAFCEEFKRMQGEEM